MIKLNWVPIGAGQMTLCHRPGRKDIPSLPALGCQRVVTLLWEGEGGQTVGSAIEALGLKWTWVPLRNGRYPQGEAHARLVTAIPRISQFLDEGEAVMIHCAAGIHRTGMVALGVLFWRGYTEPEALELIGQMRGHTRAGLLPRQFLWARDYLKTLPTTPNPEV